MKFSDIILSLEKFLVDMGYELIQIDERDSFVQVTIDNLSENPITIEDCVKVSKLIESKLDKVMQGWRINYVLEVSSPGSNRPLSKWEHFQKFLGSNIAVEHLDSQKIVGKLVEVNNGNVVLQTGGIDELQTIAYNTIRKANIVEREASFSKKR